MDDAVPPDDHERPARYARLSELILHRAVDRGEITLGRERGSEYETQEGRAKQDRDCVKAVHMFVYVQGRIS